MKYFRPKYILFIFRLLLLKFRYGNKIFLNSAKVGFEENTQVIISGLNSSITFGDINYFYRLGNLEARDGGKITFGDHVSINKGFSIVCRSQISFGNNIMIGPNVMIYDHNHKFEICSLPFRLQEFVAKPIYIGSNVWIGADVFIGSGVSIGSNSVIAAGTVITKDVPVNSLIGGQPSRVLRQLL
jgi:acetyltransferase-like isoleucine patch superfamily enzyme